MSMEFVKSMNSCFLHVMISTDNIGIIGTNIVMSYPCFMWWAFLTNLSKFLV